MSKATGKIICISSVHELADPPPATCHLGHSQPVPGAKFPREVP
jgi:hypothetical protein